MTTRERVRRHHQTLISLKRRDQEAVTPPLPESPTPSQVEVQDDVIRMSEEEGEGEEESEVLLALSESSPSSTGLDLADPESEKEQEVMSRASEAEEEESVLQPQEQQQDSEELFAQDYLLRVCDAVQVRPGLSEQLLQILDQFSADPLAAPELLFGGLSGVLQPWPQLLKDFAAFLTPGQARRCGLLVEQQLFERSRQFLRQLGRSLGEGSVLHQQVVSVLQGSSTPSPEDMHKISSLLKHHPHLQEDFWEFFQQLHARSANQLTRDRQEEEESERPLCAKNVLMTSSGEKVVMWTREADRTILTACQQGGANHKTFRRVSAQLGNKTAQQVSFRFHELMNLFHSTSQTSTSCLESQPISMQEAVLD